MKNDLEYKDGGKRWAAYFSDVVTIGRLNLNLGFRVDRWKDFKDALVTRGIHQEVHSNQYFANYVDIAQDNIDADTIPLLAALLPDGGRPGVESQKLFVNISPRLGLTYDIFGDGRTIFKAGFALYRGSGLSDTYWTPYGVYGNINFWWHDEDGNGKVGFREAYWADYSDSNRPTYRIFDDAGTFVGNYEREEGLHWGSMTWGQNVLSDPRDFVDLTGDFHPNGKPYTPSKTYEVTVGIEREIFRDFGVSGSFTWKREGNFAWDRDYYPELDHIRSRDDYEVVGTIPDTVYDPGDDGLFGTGDDIAYDTGMAAGRPWYEQEVADTTAYTSYDMLAMYPDVNARRNIYTGFDLVFNKRLSNKWMFNGSVTLQMDKRYYGNVNYADPTNQWVYDGKINAPTLGGGSGKISRPMFSRWMVKLMGLYQFPWDINVSGTFSAHEGSFYYTALSLQDRTLPNPRSYSATIYTADYDNRDRLGDVFVANIKVEKMLKLGQTGRMYLSADLFNVFNSDKVLRKRDVSYGTFRFTGTYEGNPTPYRYYRPSATSGEINEIMNPLILRIGVRFQI
jgi:hypothetical protein